MSTQLIPLIKYMYEKLKTNKRLSRFIGCISLFLISRYIYNKSYRKYYSLPPGPESIIPKFGVLLSTILFNRQSWHINMAKKYGDIMAFYEINRYIIIINNSFIAKQVLSNKNAINRDMNMLNPNNTFNMIAATDNTPSFLQYNGTIWYKMRQLMSSKLIRVLNTKALNKIIHGIIKKDLAPSLSEIILNNNGIWYPRNLLTKVIFNTIFEANFGESASTNNKLCTELTNDMDKVLSWNISKRTAITRLFPSLSYMFVSAGYFKPIFDLRKKITENIKKMIKEKNNRNNFNNDSYYDTFMDNTNKLKNSKDNKYTESQEIADIFLMFLAGTDTTSITTEFGLILLAKQQNIQNKVRNELKKNIQNTENIIFDIGLLLRLPYFRALIHEILRISCVVRLGVPHEINPHDIWIETGNGIKYRLPKGSTLHYNVQCINHNKIGKENWKNTMKNPSYEICLENWINDGKFFYNPSFITFGHGKRNCVGRELAVKQMRIIIGYLLLNYKFSLQTKYKNMQNIPSKGGVRIGVAKPNPATPVIVQQIVD